MASVLPKYPLLLLVFLALIVAAAIDLKTQKIPNILTLPLMVIASGYHLFLNGVEGFLFSILGLLLGIGLLIVPYLMGGMGAGDAKLMGAVGAVVGPKGVFFAFLFSAVAGGIYALFLVILKHEHFKGFFRKMYFKLQIFFITRKFTPEDRNPSEPRLCYGLAIAVGSIAYLVFDISGYAFPI